MNGNSIEKLSPKELKAYSKYLERKHRWQKFEEEHPTVASVLSFLDALAGILIITALAALLIYA